MSLNSYFTAGLNLPPPVAFLRTHSALWMGVGHACAPNTYPHRHHHRHRGHLRRLDDDLTLAPSLVHYGFSYTHAHTTLTQQPPLNPP